MQIGRSAQGIAAYPTRPYGTFAEAVTAAKAQPGKISVGALAASLAQIFLAFMQKENGFEMNTIPYKGGGPLYQDALAGVIDLTRAMKASTSELLDCAVSTAPPLSVFTGVFDCAAISLGLQSARPHR